MSADFLHLESPVTPPEYWRLKKRDARDRIYLAWIRGEIDEEFATHCLIGLGGPTNLFDARQAKEEWLRKLVDEAAVPLEVNGGGK